MTETIYIPSGLMQVLLNWTAGDIELQGSQMRSLVQCLHRAELQAGGRWHTKMTQADIYAVHCLILAWAGCAPPAQVSRYTNWMCRQSVVYERLHAEHNAKKTS
mgnify:CR=1 FL=1